MPERALGGVLVADRGVDAATIERLGADPILVLRPMQSHDYAVAAVQAAAPWLTPDEAEAIVRTHLPTAPNLADLFGEGKPEVVEEPAVRRDVGAQARYEVDSWLVFLVIAAVAALFVAFYALNEPVRDAHGKAPVSPPLPMFAPGVTFLSNGRAEPEPEDAAESRATDDERAPTAAGTPSAKRREVAAREASRSDSRGPGQAQDRQNGGSSADGPGDAQGSEPPAAGPLEDPQGSLERLLDDAQGSLPELPLPPF